MDEQKKKYQGTTNVLSEAKPTPRDLELNGDLIEYLKSINNFETPEGNDRRCDPSSTFDRESACASGTAAAVPVSVMTCARNRVLSHLQKVTEEFVRRVGRKKGGAPTVLHAEPDMTVRVIRGRQSRRQSLHLRQLHNRRSRARIRHRHPRCDPPVR